VTSLPFEVAVRYLKSRPSRLISSVSLLSIAGIALGVAALVVAMGLLSGYRTEIREKLIGANAEVVLFPLMTGGEADPAAVERRVAAVPGVRATAPVIYQAGVAASAATPDGVDAVLKGIDPAAEARVSELEVYLPNAASVVTPGSGGRLAGVAIGAELARRLDVREGDTITLSVADNSGAGARFAPRSARFRVSRIFRTNFSEYDSEWVFLDREELRRLARLPGQANVIEVRLDSIGDTEAAASAIGRAAGKGYSVSDWRSMNGGLFSALVIQQTTLFLLIGLIVAVSTFNIVATLVMTVQEKKRDIGVLTTLGAEPRFFSRVFLCLGAQQINPPKTTPVRTPVPPSRAPSQRNTREKKPGSAPSVVRTPMSRFFSWTVITSVATMLKVETATIRPIRRKSVVCWITSAEKSPPFMERQSDTE
jgi:lipoprotein-releasing system permease protein